MATASTDPLARLEAILALEGPDAPSRRMLVIINPYATTVSGRLKNLVVYALRGRYDVVAVDTERRDHATELCRRAAGEGFDVVVAFGGDGTVNEAANGLVGSDTPLCCLPGGRANVYCRMLGIPADVIDATEHLLGLAHDWHPRRVDLGRVNERCFLFSAGVGLDASVVETVDARPRLKARLGEWYYTWSAISTFTRRYLVHPPGLRAELGNETVDGVTAIIQNSDPYTYFGDRAVRMGEGAALDSGDLAGVVLTRANPIDMPSISWRALSGRSPLTGHRRIHGYSGLTELRIAATGDRALPLQVDGDYIGELREAVFQCLPRAMLVVS
ncbi:MAG: diacylglycerol kinase family protein [Solirubrobacteraceae bacterium]